MLNLETHDKQPFDLSKAVASSPATVLIVFRGPWCPYCQEYWEDLADDVDRFTAAGAQIIGLSADRPKALRRFRRKHDLPFLMVSDKKLTAKKVLGVKKESMHPAAMEYREGAFLQPGVFIWTQDGRLHYSWVQKPKFGNFYGAAKRPRPKKILKRVTAALNPEPAAEPEAPEAAAPPASDPPAPKTPRTRRAPDA
jgi:peroxiredoxin